VVDIWTYIEIRRCCLVAADECALGEFKGGFGCRFGIELFVVDSLNDLIESFSFFRRVRLAGRNGDIDCITWFDVACIKFTQFEAIIYEIIRSRFSNTEDCSVLANIFCILIRKRYCS